MDGEKISLINASILPADHRSGPLIRIRSAANVERRFTVVFRGRTAAPHLPRPSEVGGGIEKGGSGLGTLEIMDRIR